MSDEHVNILALESILISNGIKLHISTINLYDIVGVMVPYSSGNKLKSFFQKKCEYFYLLDFGGYSLKLALLEVTDTGKTARILQVVEEPVERPLVSSISDLGRDQAHILKCVKQAQKRIKMPRAFYRRRPKLVIGISNALVQGHNFSYLHKRENPEIPIDLGEIKNIFQNAQVAAYEDIRKKLSQESPYQDIGKRVILPALQEIKLDGRLLSSPLGMLGDELYISIFNAYLPGSYADFLQNLSRAMGLKLHSWAYEPYALFGSLIRGKDADFGALIIDIGGYNTRISLARKGKLEDVRIFSYGGESFTNRISKELKLNKHSAGDIKILYGAGKISKNAKRALENLLQRELSLFLRALEFILKDFSQSSLLPANIYVYGGGGAIPLIDGIIKKRGWKKDLSFLTPPKIQRLDPGFFRTTLADNIEFRHNLVSLLALSDHTLNAISQKEDILLRTLQRMARIIQDTQ